MLFDRDPSLIPASIAARMVAGRHPLRLAAHAG
jgi:hypothetical protein